jgi:hypothetical protein
MAIAVFSKFKACHGLVVVEPGAPTKRRKFLSSDGFGVLAAIFLGSLLFWIWSLIFLRSPTFCDQKESLGVCAREWLGVGGAWAAGIGALFALIYLSRQITIMQEQLRHEREVRLAEILDVARSVASDLTEAAEAVKPASVHELTERILSIATGSVSVIDRLSLRLGSYLRSAIGEYAVVAKLIRDNHDQDLLTATRAAAAYHLHLLADAIRYAAALSDRQKRLSLPVAFREEAARRVAGRYDYDWAKLSYLESLVRRDQ